MFYGFLLLLLNITIPKTGPINIAKDFVFLSSASHLQIEMQSSQNFNKDLIDEEEEGEHDELTFNSVLPSFFYKLNGLNYFFNRILVRNVPSFSLIFERFLRGPPQLLT